MKNRIKIVLLGVALLSGCSGYDIFGPDDDNVAVNFSAGIEATRTTGAGDEWAATDKVGISMLATGGNMTTSADLITGNREYNAVPDAPASSATFSPASGTPIYYPNVGNVDFVAYYPYGSIGAGTGQVNAATYTYNISVANQSNPAAIDLLYAKTTNVSKSKTVPVALAFGHVMSKVTFNITAGNGINATNIQNLAATAIEFGGMPVTAALALQDGTVTAGSDLTQTFNPLKGVIPGSVNYHATFSAILVPQPTGHGLTGRTVLFTVGGQSYTWTIPDGDTFAEANHYTYMVTVNNNGITVGAPSIVKWNERDNGAGSATEIRGGISWVKIPAGTFLMGSSDGSHLGDTGTWSLNATPEESGRISYETQHSVTLTKDFYMSKYAVTNAQYAVFLNAAGIGSGGTGNVTYDNNGSSTTTSQRFIYAYSSYGLVWNSTDSKWVPATGYEHHPVVYVTWYGAKAFADYYGYSLPTEAQWEYACRGGQSTSLPFGIGEGTKLTHDMANFHTYWPYDVAQGGNYNDVSGTGNVGQTTAVGSYPYANGYGLYDMHGNVWEWCLDQWGGTDNYTSLSPTDPLCIAGINRVLRGGSWLIRAQNCRSAFRYGADPGIYSDDVGFRVAVVP